MDDDLNQLVKKMIESQEIIAESQKQIITMQTKLTKSSNTKSLIIGILASVIVLIFVIFSSVNYIEDKNYINSLNAMYQSTVKAFENQQITVETSADASGSTVSTTNNNNNNNTNTNNTNVTKNSDKK